MVGELTAWVRLDETRVGHEPRIATEDVVLWNLAFVAVAAPAMAIGIALAAGLAGAGYVAGSLMASTDEG